MRREGGEVSSRWWWLWRRRLPHLWPGSGGEGHGGRRGEWERRAWCTYVGMCILPSPAPTFLGKGKLSVAIVFVPSLWSPPHAWCSVVGQPIVWGVYLHWKMRCSLYFNHGRSVGFPSLQYRSWAALTLNPKCYGRARTAVHEASGNFTCRFKSIIMTPKLENLELPKTGSFLYEAVACRARHEVSKLPKLTGVFYNCSSKQIVNKKVI